MGNATHPTARRATITHGAHAIRTLTNEVRNKTWGTKLVAEQIQERVQAYDRNDPDAVNISFDHKLALKSWTCIIVAIIGHVPTLRQKQKNIKHEKKTGMPNHSQLFQVREP